MTKACFFLHFPRAHRNLFCYSRSRSEKEGLDREALVQKLNKQSIDRATRSMRASGTGKSLLLPVFQTNGGSTGVSSVRATRSVRHQTLTTKETSKLKEMRKTHKKHGKGASMGAGSSGGGLFGDLDFGDGKKNLGSDE